MVSSKPRPSEEDERVSKATGTFRWAVDWLGEHLVLPGSKAKLRRHLSWAGRASARDVSSTLDAKIGYGLAGVGLGLVLMIPYGLWGLIAVVVLGACGYFLPDVLVYNAGLRRSEEIMRALPDALDLLDLCVESGLSLQAALARVAQTQPGPVAAEFARVLREMKLGRSRSEAFEALGQRTTQPDLGRFVTSIQQAEKLGIPVGAVLKEQAVAMRARRQEKAREAAQKVPVKILAPLMLCFLPGLFIIILGPAAVNAVNFFTQ